MKVPYAVFREKKLGDDRWGHFNSHTQNEKRARYCGGERLPHVRRKTIKGGVV